MKKISKILLIPIVMLCFAFTTSSSFEATELKQPNVVEEFIKTEEGIRCVIRDAKTGRVIASCWFCSCSRLAKAALKQN